MDVLCVMLVFKTRLVNTEWQAAVETIVAILKISNTVQSVNSSQA